MTYEKNMMDYVFWCKENNPHENGRLVDRTTWFMMTVENKADFLKSPPKLGDFVPTNEKGEVMERPFDFGNWEKAHYPSAKRMRVHEDYQSALDRRLWVGWEYYPEKKELYLNNKRIGYFSYSEVLVSINGNGEFKSYEKLINSGVKLERIQRK